MPIFDKILLKFVFVGIINTLTGSSIMFILYNIAGIGYWLSSAANYVVGGVLSFFLNKYFTFSVKNWSLFMVVAFVINIAICYGIAYGVAKPIMNYILKNNPQNLRENVALLAGMCLFTGLNYLGQRLIVFRKKENKEG